MRVLRAGGHRRMPWRNGGGETLEVAVFPDGSDLDAFGWRVSIATVAAGGPFSVFPGVDRTLTLMSGDGMELAVDGAVHRLVPGGDPFAFPGDAATSARLVGGAITDLNVMTRRGAFVHRVVRLDAGGRPAGPVAFVVAADRARLVADGAAVDLDPLDVAVVEDGDGRVAAGRASDRLYAVEIAPA
jgi:uncharacterized protein